MSVTIRPHRRGGWEADDRVVTPDGARQIRERKRAPVSSRSAAERWAEGRERILFLRLMDPLQHTTERKEGPTLGEFASRFLDGHARANRQKPSSIAAKDMIICVALRVGGHMSPLRRLWNLVRRSRVDHDLREEFDLHLALIEEEARARRCYRQGGAPRRLMRSPVFTLATVLTLALAIAANVAVSSPSSSASSSTRCRTATPAACCRSSTACVAIRDLTDRVFGRDSCAIGE